MITTVDIESALAGHTPELLEGDGATRAVVALILSEGSAGARILFIERAANEKDPWSGHICFPGGRVEEGDSGPRSTAERETLEEIGLDLARERCLGRLSDTVGARIPIHLACFVYRTAGTGPFRLMDEEVRDAFWVSLEDLRDPARRGDKVVRFDGQEWVRPGISLPHPGEPVLWGLTYEIVMDFLRLVGAD